MTELKNCPFCGSGDIDPKGWMTLTTSGPECNNCGATACSAGEWNTRHIPEGCALVSTLQLELCVAHLKTQSPVNGNTVLVIENMIKAAQEG